METNIVTSRMTREIHEMPQDVEWALNERGLMRAYNARPAYQQNDYVGWITRARREETVSSASTRCSTNSRRAASTCG